MSNITTNLLAFILVLGFLIFAHEAGHFFMAKLFRVKVLVFSFGFGRRLFGFKKGDTDYRVSLIPLGGYVRMAGDTPDEGGPILATGAPDEFLSKPKWQRFLILFAGPGMNILIAIAFVAAINMIGLEHLVIRPVIGEIEPNMPAAKAGLRPGDEVVRINDEPITDYEDLVLAIRLNAGTPLQLEYVRDGKRLTTTMTPARIKGEYGPVGKAGFGMFVEPVIGKVREGSPAWNAGLRPGDKILSVNGEPITSLTEFTEIAVKVRGKALPVSVERAGSTVDVTLAAVQYNEDDLSRGFIGPVAMRKLSLAPAIKESVRENWKMLKYSVNAIGRIFRAEGSVKELSGPIDIARISGEMLRRGWVALVMLMAMISLQLGVMNLLPIPVLDGGHIAILLVEGVARRDLSLNAKERIQQLGFAVLAALMIVVLYNDVMKNVFG